MWVKIVLCLIFLLGEDHAGGKGVCRRLMSTAQETQSMREIPAEGGMVNRYAILIIPEF
jgi:hypothetical protein